MIDKDYIAQTTGILAVAGLVLIALIIGTIFWHWLALPACLLAGALTLPIYRWYHEFLS